MTGKLLMHLLQVNASTGLSANIFESDGVTGVKFYHWETWQTNPHNAAVYHVLGKTMNRCKIGKSHIDDVQIQLTIWHTDSIEAATVAANIRTVLEGWEGEHDGILYYKILLDGEQELYEDEIGMYGVAQTWIISEKRTVV